MLKKDYRLTSSRDFKVIYRHGQKIKGQFGMLIVLTPREKNEELPKFGFVVSKKVGNAVVRHKVTRRLRTLVHEMIESYGDQFTGYRFSYISFKDVEEFQELKNEFKWQLEKATKVQ